MAETVVPGLERRLKAHLLGEVNFDAFTRGRYATDASHYQIMPVGVVAPRSMKEAEHFPKPGQLTPNFELNSKIQTSVGIFKRNAVLITTREATKSSTVWRTGVCKGLRRSSRITDCSGHDWPVENSASTKKPFARWRPFTR